MNIMWRDEEPEALIVTLEHDELVFGLDIPTRLPVVLTNANGEADVNVHVDAESKRVTVVYYVDPA